MYGIKSLYLAGVRVACHEAWSLFAVESVNNLNTQMS